MDGSFLGSIDADFETKYVFFSQGQSALNELRMTGVAASDVRAASKLLRRSFVRENRGQELPDESRHAFELLGLVGFRQHRAGIEGRSPRCQRCEHQEQSCMTG